MNSYKQVSVAATLMLTMLIPFVSSARSQVRTSRWRGVEFPDGLELKVDLRIIDFTILKKYAQRPIPPPPPDSGEPAVDTIHGDTAQPQVWARVTRNGDATAINCSSKYFQSNATYYLYVIDQSGSVVNFWKLTTSDSGDTDWPDLITSAGTFMLVLSISDKLTNFETDKNVFMTSDVPEGFRAAPLTRPNLANPNRVPPL